MWREDMKRVRGASVPELRNFGLVVGGVFCAVGLYFLARGKWFSPYVLVPGVPLVVLGALFPRALRWPYVVWMTLAMALGAVVSTLLLVVLFYGVVTLIGLIARATGKDFLSRQLDRSAASCWLRRPAAKKAPADYERQF
jgi:hypothetical protein